MSKKSISNRKKRSSLLVILLFSIGLTITVFNFIQTWVVARNTRLSVESARTIDYQETVNAYVEQEGYAMSQVVMNDGTGFLMKLENDGKYNVESWVENR